VELLAVKKAREARFKVVISEGYSLMVAIQATLLKVSICHNIGLLMKNYTLLQ
jgi:hypothetical protein